MEGTLRPYDAGGKRAIGWSFAVRLCVLALAVAAALLAFPATLLAQQDGAVAEGATELSVGEGPGALGVRGFVRNNKGTLRAVGDTDLGYRFPVDASASIVVVRAPACVLVHVDAASAAAVGFDVDDAEDVAHLQGLIEDLDQANSWGGVLLRDVRDPWIVTSDDVVERGAYCYDFDAVAAGERYMSVSVVGAAADSPREAAEAMGVDLGDGALWCDAAELVDAGSIAAAQRPSPLEALVGFLQRIDYRPLLVSVKTSAVALCVSFVLGLLAAWKTLGSSSRLKGVLDSVFTIPMVLPPTVCGFLLLMCFGKSTAFGCWLIDHGISIVFTWPAAVISAIVVSFPLVYRTTLGAFESLDAQMLDAARTLGWSEFTIFRRLMMPLAWPSIASGTVLAFARAMGEFGCTLFFAGNYAGVTQTIPIAIYFEWMGGDTAVALFWVAVVIVFSFLVILFINLYTAHSQRYRGRTGCTGRVRRGARGDARAAAPFADERVDEAGESGDVVRIDREALTALLLDGAKAPKGEA